MRASQTCTEQLLWARIRGRRLGVVIRRQVPLFGRFSAGFLAPAQCLVTRSTGRIMPNAAALARAEMLPSIAPDIVHSRRGIGCRWRHRDMETSRHRDIETSR